MFEVEDQPNTAFAYPKVIQHLSAFMIRDAVNDFGINDDGIEDKKIWDEFTDVLDPEQHRESALLIEGNASQAKDNGQSILVDILVKPVSYLIQNFKGTADNFFRFSFKD
jgi:hypothetical protein